MQNYELDAYLGGWEVGSEQRARLLANADDMSAEQFAAKVDQCTDMYERGEDIWYDDNKWFK